MEVPVVPKKSGRPRRASASLRHYDQITVHLPADLVSALDAQLGARGMTSRSALIREACRRYLTNQQAEPPSLVRRMETMSREEQDQIMEAAAVALADYYRTDPEIAAFHALDSEDFYDIDE